MRASSAPRKSTGRSSGGTSKEQARSASHTCPAHDNRQDYSDHNIIMAFGYVLGLVARGREKLSMLDWGGGCGHYFLYAMALYPDLALEYHCFDLPDLCAAGRRLVPGANFHDDLSEIQGRRYDLVVSSSALHYFEDWRGTLAQLSECTGDALYVSRLQTVDHAWSFVAMQRPYSSGYVTEYPSWFLNKEEFLTAAEPTGLRLVREFVFDEKWYVREAPEQGHSRGFLFMRDRSH
jgi:putative methyltransferase (TIGR04325 family)